MIRHTLMVNCPDRKGLIFDITRILLSHELNIIENDQFVDTDSNKFFMRTEFTGSFDSGRLYSDLEESLGREASLKLLGSRKKNIVILATKEHHCLGDILIRHFFNDINANIQAVISNHEVLRELTEKMDIPYHFVSHENLSREDHEQKVMTILNQYNPEYIVLAKYMRILSPSFTGLYPGRIVNIHHSFLPAFIGANPYKQAYARGVKMIGATAHFVNHNLDEGPIIEQNIVHITHKESAEDLAKAGRDVEKIVLSKALQLVLEDRVFLSGNRTVVFR